MYCFLNICDKLSMSIYIELPLSFYQQHNILLYVCTIVYLINFLLVCVYLNCCVVFFVGSNSEHSYDIYLCIYLNISRICFSKWLHQKLVSGAKDSERSRKIKTNYCPLDLEDSW